MSPVVLQILEDLADPLRQLVEREVRREVARQLERKDAAGRTRDFSREATMHTYDLPATPARVSRRRGLYLLNERYEEGDIVEFGDSEYYAVAATTEVPGSSARAWQEVTRRAAPRP